MSNAEKFEAGIPINMSESDWDEWYKIRDQIEEMKFASFMINHREESRNAITKVGGVNVINVELYKSYERSKR